MSMKPNEFKDKFRGVVNLVMTPFDKNGDLDIPSLKLGVRNLVNKCKGEEVCIMTLGTTGEFYAMTEEENRQVSEIVVEEVNGVLPVIIGTAREATRNSIQVSKEAEKIGADAVMIVHPYYVLPTETEIINHYKAIADALSIGVVVYNNPTTSKINLGIKTLKELSKVDNIVGLKENSNNPMTFLNIMQTLDKKDISIVAGLGHFMYQFMCYYGLTGYVTEQCNFAPELAIKLFKAGQAHDVKAVREIVDTSNLFWDFVDKMAARRTSIPTVLPGNVTPTVMPFYQAANKAAMTLTGTPGGIVRAPMCNLTPEEYKELAGVLVKMGCKLA